MDVEPKGENRSIAAQPEQVYDTARRIGPPAVAGAVEYGDIPSSEFERRAIIIDFPGVSPDQVDALLAERVPATTIRPHLVLPEEISAPDVYKRLGERDQKNRYRAALRADLHAAWQAEYGDDRATEILDKFNQLSAVIEEDGAVVFGDLIGREPFGQLVEAYDGLMERDGSTSLLHSYANLRNQPDFLINKAFNGAFFHPLAMALISDRVGGAIRVVDARAKDAGQMSVRAQDNMLHVDNTPYRDEYKVLVTWEKGKASGPKGQNFVFLPGTHKGVRDSLVGPAGPYSTENASIFIQPGDVDQVFALQQRVRPGGKAVVEIQDPDRPLTTLFPSGSLVHHRLRTESGHARSGLIIAFHRAADTPGEFIGDYPQAAGQDLEGTLFGYQDGSVDEDFARVLAGYAGSIAQKVEEIYAADGQTVVIDARAKSLTEEEQREWYRIATEAPTVEAIKQKDGYFPLGQELDSDAFMDVLLTMMAHDKHGPIDMILYADGHEEPRKWARNRIREMKEDSLQGRLSGWQDQIKQPTVDDLLTIDELTMITSQLVDNARAVSPADRSRGHLDPIERISPQEAYRSVEQLITDLGENLTRADDRQTYLSASLFQFWACDELNRLQGNDNPQLRQLGGRLLRNYIAAAVLIEKQIAQR